MGLGPGPGKRSSVRLLLGCEFSSWLGYCESLSLSRDVLCLFLGPVKCRSWRGALITVPVLKSF